MAGGSLACTPVIDSNASVPAVSNPGQQAEPTGNFSIPALPFAQQMTAIDSLSQHQGQTVIVRGDVRRQVPLAAGQLYQLQDNTGSIWVATRDESVDVALGNRVTVQGTVHYEDIQISGSNLSEYYIESERLQLETASTD